ncbi:MAG: sugar ABC transporter permease [Clostridiales bacterium]|nr:sugar ABC transporter permease [Clostridiales bacterium]
MQNKFRLRQEAPYLLFILPALIAYTIFVVTPLVLSFRYAFTNWDGVNDPKWVGFNNFTTAFTDKTMRTAIFNTIKYSVFVPAIVTILAIPLAVLLNMPMRTRNFQRAAFFFPSVPSALIVGYIWGYILNPTKSGMLNQVLMFFGMEKPLLFLAKPNLAFPSLIAVAVWQTVGWHACIYLANLQSIPKDYYEAATIDGANGWQQFRAITFPMLAPSMTISVMLLLTGSLKVFDLPFALTGGGPGYTTTMITQIIITKGVAEKMYGKATALSIIFFGVIFLLTTIQLTIMKKREGKL